jgi:putative FmdB family regulatory protein
MPVYDYDCEACGRRFELVHGVHAEPPMVCPLCGGGPIRKAISAPAIHYKGSGWAKKERRTASSSASRSTAEGSSGDGPSGETGTGSDKAGSDKAGSDGTSTSTKATEAATANPAD